MGTKRQRKVWLLNDCYYDVITGMFCNPVYKANRVNTVNVMLKRAMVLVKAVLSYYTPLLY